MIVLDTNVISELVRPAPDRNVLEWLDAEPVEALFITAVTAAELLFGVERLPAGRRRSALGFTVGEVLATDFAGRILPFDAGAAVVFGRVVADRERQGRPMSMATP